jgi:acetolactate synthase-1/2/3 large subunit
LIVPYNVFKETTESKPKQVDLDSLKFWESNTSSASISKIRALIIGSKKIIFWIGNSLNKKEQSEQLFKLAEKYHIPVATTYSGKGSFPENHELALGNFGYAASNLANEVFLSDAADVIIGFDIEQNERNTFMWNPKLYEGNEIILVNYPGSYFNKKYGKTITDNPLFVLKSLFGLLEKEEYDSSSRKRWFNRVLQNITLKSSLIPALKNGTIEPGSLIQILQKELPEESILFVDSGTHRVFPGFYWHSPVPQSFYSSSLVAALGWAVAAGIGCKFSRSEPVVIFTGDGCMQMHGIEIKTAVKHNMPVLIILTNNSAFGAIYNRYAKISESAARMASITEIDWNMFGKSLGAKVFEITTEKQFIQQIHAFISDQKPTILNVRTPVSPYIYDVNLVKSVYA